MESLSRKLLNAYKIVLSGGMNDNWDRKFESEPINNLLTNYEEIVNIIKSGKDRIYQFLYFISGKMYQILYESDKLINLDFLQKKNNDLSELFYLDLMIINVIELQNFGYSLEFIENINNIHIDEIYKKVLYSKIIIDLINNINQEKEEENDTLEKIKEYNKKIIDDNLSEFNKIINNKDIFEDKIDEIYSSILEKLIKNNEFRDYDYVSNILKQLDYENIYLTGTMLESLKSTLNSSDDFINNYKISDIFDLINDNTKINFYFILFKYILKNPFYIYQIDFLKNFQKVIIDSLKINLERIKDSLKPSNNNNNEKIIYIIKSLDAYYYFNKPIINQLNSSNKKNNSSSNATRTKSHEKNETIHLKLSKKEEKVKDILKNFYFEYDFNLNENNKSDENSYFKKMELINKEIGTQDIVNHELLKNFKKFKKVLEEFDKELNLLDKLNNKNAFLEMRFERIGENEAQDFYDITCNFDLFTKQGDKLTKLKSFKAYNILKTGIIKTRAFLYFKKTSVPIINKEFLKLNSNSSIVSSSSSSITGLKSYKNSIFYSSINAQNVENYLTNKKNYYEIMNLEKILFKHRKEAEFVVETPNNYFISFGMENDIYIYDNNFNKVDEFVIGYEKPNNSNNSQSISKNDIIICSIRGVVLLKFQKADSKYNLEKLKSDPSTFFFKINNNNYIFATKTDLIIYKSLNQEIDRKGLALAGGIKLGDIEAAFTSNSNLPGGKDKIYFYFSNKAEIQEGAINEEYSFTISDHSMELMTNKKGEKTFLLCACKKYKKGQKNGILLINLENGQYEHEFFGTDDFEVYCLCPLYITVEKNSSKNHKNKKETEAYSTNYFLAGGFEVDKNKGAIKLFKLNIEEKNDDKDNKNGDKKEKEIIEFVQDIEFENTTVKKFKNMVEGDYKSKKLEYEFYDFTGFERNISCITQSQKTGKLLITCWDGNVYLFSAPNISYYLNQDLEEEKNKKNKMNLFTN